MCNKNETPPKTHRREYQIKQKTFISASNIEKCMDVKE
ncbi:hypothetical protein C7M52_02841 [Mixta theicola]|nr:hypothetical protein C7M52_02841 [Mixta theicola]